MAAETLEKGTGAAIGKAVCDTLDTWNLQERVVAMVFDTTAVNTGPKNGACIHIEQKLGTKLLNLACRHHVYELVIRSVFETSFKLSTNGPEVGLFNRFKNQWENIDPLCYQTALTDQNVLSLISLDKRQEVISFCNHILTQQQPRDDYREFLELVLIFLGDIKNPTFKKPGATHHARWMSKCIYSLKI